MGKRKLSHLRLYKILKIIVLVYSVPVSLYGIYGIFNYSNFSEKMLNGFHQCSESLLGGQNSMDICGSFIDGISQYENAIKFSLITGFGLLVVFFGGIKLYKYLFPKSE